MGTIRDLPSAWRDRLVPAHFDGCEFHVESGTIESGRRIVVHEFPKKEQPYAEDMGRKAVEWQVRAYCIVFPNDSGAISGSLLYRRDYQLARDVLNERLWRGGPGWLQLPTFKPMFVVCQRFRLTEEERAGGYCVFDMSFVERGVRPFTTTVDSRTKLEEQANFLKNAVQQVWAGQSSPVTPAWLSAMRSEHQTEWQRQVRARSRTSRA